MAHNKQDWQQYNFETTAVHSGSEPDPRTGAVTCPISLSSTFAQKSPGEKYEGGYEYSRSSNPSRDALERQVADLEGGKYGFAFSSGLAATNTICSLLKPGEGLLSCKDAYGGTIRLFSKVIQPWAGTAITYVEMDNLEAFEAAFTPSTKLVWLETPTNPMLTVADIERVAEITHAKGAILVVDNTFSSSFCQRPLSLGADIVMHSATKYMNGHSDVVMGLAVLNDDELHLKLRYMQNAIGSIPSPFDSYLCSRGLKTLHLRMERHSTNALRVAEYLESHPKVQRVIYPGLPSHPQHATAVKQMKKGYYSGMIGVTLKGGLEQARQFLSSSKLFVCAESLGAVESLMEHPAIMTHAGIAPETRAELGISDSFVRLSVGVENIEDLLADLEATLNCVEL
jgi:cystathionine gamma-lyase